MTATLENASTAKTRQTTHTPMKTTTTAIATPFITSRELQSDAVDTASSSTAIIVTTESTMDPAVANTAAL